jgi:hypothetical protein
VSLNPYRLCGDPYYCTVYSNTTVCTANKVEHSECGVEGGAFILDCYIDKKKENQIFLIYQESQSGAVAKSYMRKGFLIYEENWKCTNISPYMRRPLVIHEFATAPF